MPFSLTRALGQSQTDLELAAAHRQNVDLKRKLRQAEQQRDVARAERDEFKQQAQDRVLTFADGRPPQVVPDGLAALTHAREVAQRDSTDVRIWVAGQVVWTAAQRGGKTTVAGEPTLNVPYSGTLRHRFKAPPTSQDIVDARRL